MQATQERIADLWCKWMHTAPMWPAHGQYECRICGRHHRVCWEQPLQTEPRVMEMSFVSHDETVLATRT